MLPDNYICEGQMSIFDLFPENKPEEKTEVICKDAMQCEAYPIGCGGTVSPCRFGGPFKWSNVMNPPVEDK